jgi:hypothetical protein
MVAMETILPTFREKRYPVAITRLAVHHRKELGINV